MTNRARRIRTTRQARIIKEATLDALDRWRRWVGGPPGGLYGRVYREVNRRQAERSVARELARIGRRNLPHRNLDQYLPLNPTKRKKRS